MIASSVGAARFKRLCALSICVAHGELRPGILVIDEIVDALPRGFQRVLLAPAHALPRVLAGHKVVEKSRGSPVDDLREIAIANEMEFARLRTGYRWIH